MGLMNSTYSVSLGVANIDYTWVYLQHEHPSAVWWRGVDTNVDDSTCIILTYEVYEHLGLHV